MGRSSAQRWRRRRRRNCWERGPPHNGRHARRRMRRTLYTKTILSDCATASLVASGDHARPVTTYSFRLGSACWGRAGRGKWAGTAQHAAQREKREKHWARSKSIARQWKCHRNAQALWKTCPCAAPHSRQRGRSHGRTLPPRAECPPGTTLWHTLARVHPAQGSPCASAAASSLRGNRRLGNNRNKKPCKFKSCRFKKHEHGDPKNREPRTENR